MTWGSVEITCPACGQVFALPDAVLPSPVPVSPWTAPEETEVDCPLCGHILAVDSEGTITRDDADADHELFTVDDEGDLIAEDLLHVTCPSCGCVHEASEPGVSICPRCRRLLPIDEHGWVDDGRGHHFYCRRCGSLQEGGSGPGEDHRCQGCGDYDPWLEDYEPEDEELLSLFCPNCGDGVDIDCEAVLLDPTSEGRIRCRLCEWEFTPPSSALLEWLEAYGDPGEPKEPGLGRKDNSRCRTIVVAADGSGDYHCIQEAIDRGAWGASLLVRPGRYEESLILRGPIEIIADGPPGSVVLASGAEAAVRIETEEVTLRGLHLCSAGIAALVVRGQPLLEECSIQASGRAALIVSHAWARPVLCRCTVSGVQIGLLVEGRGLARLEECEVRGGTVGIELIEGGRLEARQCRLQGGQEVQVCIRESSQGRFRDCEITDGLAGIWISGGKAHLQRCRAHHCQGPAVCVLEGMAALEECLCNQNGTGLSVRARGKALLTRCRLEANQDNLLVSGRARVLADDCEIHSAAGSGVIVRGHARLHLRCCRLGGAGRHALDQHQAAAVCLEPGERGT